MRRKRQTEKSNQIWIRTCFHFWFGYMKAISHNDKYKYTMFYNIIHKMSRSHLNLSSFRQNDAAHSRHTFTYSAPFVWNSLPPSFLPHTHLLSALLSKLISFHLSLFLFHFTDFDPWLSTDSPLSSCLLFVSSISWADGSLEGRRRWCAQKVKVNMFHY